ncbi:DUF6228 family protein [Streptomyces sp. NPDC058657]|uniref:DUF6228 family protein n=1 Tax=unclassified Streptomyces TaxID=2593676 RepID=UPI00364798BC
MRPDDTSDDLIVRVGAAGAHAVHLLFSEPTRPYAEDPTLDFIVRASGQWVSVETLVRTWEGDGLDSFLFSLAEDFRGWEGTRTWHSLAYDLTLSAEHRSGGHVHVTWGIHDRPPAEEWHFETTTVHAAGEDMLHLADEIHALLTMDTPQTS